MTCPSQGNEVQPAGRPSRLPLSLGRGLAQAIEGALAALDAAAAPLFFWLEVSRTIERLSALDDAALRRRGLTREEIVPSVYEAARAEWDRKRSP